VPEVASEDVEAEAYPLDVEPSEQQPLVLVPEVASADVEVEVLPLDVVVASP